MWHNSELIEIFVKITKDYGYEVFQSRKRCVALCGDLFADYATERSVLQMLFQAGLGESLPGEPYHTEQELRMGLVRVEAFLKRQAIEREARETVLEIVQAAFADAEVENIESLSKPILTRTFQDIHFKITIPEVTEFADRMNFGFSFIYSSKDEIDTVLEKCVITDRMNVVHESRSNHTLLVHGKSMKADIAVPHENRKIFLTEAKVELTFLCSDHKKIVVSYDSNRSHKLSFRQIEISQMDEEEYEKTLDMIMLLLKAGEVDENSREKRNREESEKNTAVEEERYVSSDIREYSDALRKEIFFLKQGKGKKYKIVNGEKINKDKGIFTYSFEMETELHLPDDAPVVVDTTSGIHAIGTVLLCEDFQIMLLVDHDLNDKVSSAYLMVEPWKLLESLNTRMLSLNPNVNRLAVQLMEDGPKLATMQDISNVPKGQKAVIEVLEDNDIITVWGPPGTGKTYTMAKIAMDYLTKGKSVLMVSHSNVSVDGVVKQVLDMVDTNTQSYLEHGKILRFGYVRDNELSKHPYATSFNFALSKCPDHSKRLDRLTLRRDELRAKKQTRTPEYDDVEKQIKKIREEIRKEERRYVEKAQLIGTTISRATIDSIFEGRQYDLVMFDEISMAYVPQVIVAAALAREKVLCVGDFRQLSPIAQSPEAKKVLQVDVFAYLKIVDGLGNMYWHPWLVMLNEQRRMHPAISEFPNKFVYKNLLLDHSSVKNNRDDIIAASPLPGDALNLINLTGTYCAASKNSDNSRYNILSAIISFATAVSADKNGMKSVGIITPYAAQTRLIRAMLRDYYEHGSEAVSCATVHQFQGSESDVLVFDAVESYPGSKVGFLMGKDMNAVTRLINVAITRARGKLIMVANVKFWENSFKGTKHIYYRFLEHILAGHKVIGHKDKSIEPYIESINLTRMLHIYTKETEAVEVFKNDMLRAKGKVLVSIPDGGLKETAVEVLNIIDDADSRGIDILMKSNDYQNLPEGWKRFCYATENAIFPLIVIDDEVAWFGLPTSKLELKVDKLKGQITVFQLMVRMKGRNTIEMIKALTSLEMVEVGSNVRQLLPKDDKYKTLQAANLDGEGKQDSGSMKSRGLAGFVEEKKFCPECKRHLVLAKNQKGTAYLKCSNSACRHMEYLDKELMNWYINVKNVKCPRADGGELNGVLGKFGPCVRCDRGHFLKPEEI